MLAVLVAALSGALTLAPVSAAPAQQATPVGSPSVPTPEECQVAPRKASDLVSAFATPAVAATPLPAAVASEAELPQGVPADEATAAALQDTARQFLACVNAGDNFRSLALVTDDFLRAQLGGAVPTAEQLAALQAQLEGAAAASPVALAREQQGALVEVRDARMLTDGRAAAVVVVSSPAANQTQQSALFVFAKPADRWLIDQIIVVAQSPAGTPAP